jgi:hypothetical protein
LKGRSGNEAGAGLFRDLYQKKLPPHWTNHLIAVA